MITTRALKEDDRGSSLLIEYILTIAISAILFAVLLLNIQSIMAKSDQIIISEEMDIAGSIVANQLADYSNQLKLNGYTSTYSVTDPLEMTRYFDIPQPYSGRQYSIEVQDVGGGAGTVKVSYVSDPNVYSVFYFNSPVPVEHVFISCNTYNLKISYVGNKMHMEEA